MPLHMTGLPNFIPHKNEDIVEGDSCFLEKKGKTLECAVMMRRGLRVQLLPEDKSGTLWVACEEIAKVVKGGAEELMSRAARIAEQKRIEEEKRIAEEERKAAEKAEKDGYVAEAAKRDAYVNGEMMRRAVPSREWMPVGKYCWTDSPVLMDQTKDMYRLVMYEINTKLDYGAVIPEPEVDLTPVEELKVEIAARNKAAEDEKKAAAKKSKKKGKPTKEEIEAEEAAKVAKVEADEAEIAAMQKKCEAEVEEKKEAWAEKEKSRVKVQSPIYPPQNPIELEYPKHPKNLSLFEELTARSNGTHCGDRVFFTDGTWHNISFVVGSEDGVCKGGGTHPREVIEEWGWKIETVELKSAFDGGRTLKKHDCFPPEDPVEWEYRENDLWAGKLRCDEDGKGSEGW